VEKARELGQMEHYERGALINEAGLPLACGDIFKATVQPHVASKPDEAGEAAEGGNPDEGAGPAKGDEPAHGDEPGEAHHWILLDQACDLQIRSEGTRGRLDGTELVRVDPTAAKRKGRDFRVPVGERQYALDGFSREVAPGDAGSVPVAQLSARLFVPYDILELCVFDREGRCRIDVDSEKPDPMPQTPGLRARYRALRAHYREVVDEIAALDAGVQGRLLVRGRLAGTLTGRVLEWPVQRVERLREARAQGALQALANDRSRAAFDRDLADPAP
jgi:hypothetical protein